MELGARYTPHSMTLSLSFGGAESIVDISRLDQRNTKKSVLAMAVVATRGDNLTAELLLLSFFQRVMVADSLSQCRMGTESMTNTIPVYTQCVVGVRNDGGEKRC